MTLAERFWSLVDEHEPWYCWEWQGYINPQNGYGQFSLNTAERDEFGMARTVTAPVMACTLAHGLRPAGQVVLHSCDWRPCCNPFHLRWGTQATNNREAWERGRQKSGEAHHQAKLSDAQVREVIERAHAGEAVVALAEEYDADWSLIYGWLRGEGRAQSLCALTASGRQPLEQIVGINPSAAA